ncbi:MAG: GSCFA domain-containing protein [Flavobacteriales bacterium]|nr:GSCFA domain-containing protein [Flavobacteriales bacterium]MDW8409471.1 GSCFA domain-containing protein [Flavobacteriales bacterium]
MFEHLKRFTPFQDVCALPRIGQYGPLVFLGSCFAENVALCFERHLWPVLRPPLGAVYQPAALARQILWLTNPSSEDPLLFQGRDGLWYSWLAHHKMGFPTSEQLVETMTFRAKLFCQLVRETPLICITLAHPFTYHEKNVDVVANCHKEPAFRFEGRMHNLDEIAQEIDLICCCLRNINPSVPIVWTLSPVRYLAQGMAVGFLGKALLRVAIHHRCSKHSLEYYFPAYEIQMDDLRDYRYYAADMVHPSQEAVEYISRHFMEAFLEPSIKATHQEGYALALHCLHRSHRSETNSQPFQQAIDFIRKHWPSTIQAYVRELNHVVQQDQIT